jgi:hypothetical protein
VFLNPHNKNTFQGSLQEVKRPETDDHSSAFRADVKTELSQISTPFMCPFTQIQWNFEYSSPVGIEAMMGSKQNRRIIEWVLENYTLYNTNKIIILYCILQYTYLHMNIKAYVKILQKCHLNILKPSGNFTYDQV